MPMRDNLKLVKFIEEKLEAKKLAITAEDAIIAGLSMETYCLTVEFDKEGGRQSRELILRRQPVSGITAPCDIILEYKIVSALQKSRVVLPEVYGADLSGDIFERPFYLMEKIEGQGAIPPMAPVLVFPDPVERASLAEDFVANLVALHTFDWQKAGVDFFDIPGPGKGSALLQVRFWEEVIVRAENRRNPVISMALNWLKANAPKNGAVTVVHGDYRSGNYLHRNGRIQAILDWEMAHLGDPHEDIAYVLHKFWRSPPPESFVSHLLTEEKFIGDYQDRSGISVDLAKVRYYEVLNELKAVGIGSKAIHEFVTKPNPDLRPGVFAIGIDPLYLLLLEKLMKKDGELP
jgi:aminoglycoside phosphotransferase (APT) family kinase protein